MEFKKDINFVEEKKQIVQERRFIHHAVTPKKAERDMPKTLTFHGETFQCCLEEGTITFFPGALYEQTFNVPYTVTVDDDSYTILSVEIPDQEVIDKIAAQIKQTKGRNRTLPEEEAEKIEILKDVINGLGKSVRLKF